MYKVQILEIIKIPTVKDRDSESWFKIAEIKVIIKTVFPPYKSCMQPIWGVPISQKNAKIDTKQP